MSIYPSLMAGNLSNLQSDIRELEPFCAGFHLDIMDFHFVPNLTFGPDFVNALRNTTDKRFWVHLMVDRPDKYIPLMHLAPQDIVSIHCEYEVDYVKKVCADIRARGLTASIALKPSTPVAATREFLAFIDHVLLMSVEPGFSGQQFIPETYARLSELNALRSHYSAHFAIGTDGGISQACIRELAKRGAKDFAVASAIFKNPNPVEALKELNKAATGE